MNMVLQVTRELCHFSGITNPLGHVFSRGGKTIGLGDGDLGINLVM